MTGVLIKGVIWTLTRTEGKTLKSYRERRAICKLKRKAWNMFSL